MMPGRENAMKWPDDAPKWHALSAAAAAQLLDSDLDAGLIIDEALGRLARDGPNEIREQGQRSLFGMIAAQLSDFMILILMAAALVSGTIGDAEDAIVIVAIVLLNAAVGFIQDFRAERAMAALRRLADPVAIVVRGGRRRTIASPEIVRGDIVLLEAGDVVPVDLRLIEAPQRLRRRGASMCLAISTPAVLPSVGRKNISAPKLSYAAQDEAATDASIMNR